MARSKSHRSRSRVPRRTNRRPAMPYTHPDRSSYEGTRRKNTHLPVGKTVSYKGHKAVIARQHDGDTYTIRFESTGKKMTVRGSSLKLANGLAVRQNKSRSRVKVTYKRRPNAKKKKSGARKRKSTRRSHR